LNRRTLLKAAGASGLAWLTPVAELLAQSEQTSRSGRAKSVILLWLAGGPSQLETFDPHPGTNIAAGTGAIATSVAGIQIAEGLPQVAEQMQEIAVVRSVVSREGDHERAAYNVKTGYRPDPSVIHPSIGAVLCHQLPVGQAEIPRHVSIVPDQWPGRGGYLGDRYDAFQMGDPIAPLPDMKTPVPDERLARRLESLNIVERQFARGRLREIESTRTLHQGTIQKAMRMMSSDQLKAFEIEQLPKSDREPFGDSPFGRGCLVAARLVEMGVRCVEVTLAGWDSHISNHDIQGERVKTLDPALASLIQYLKRRSRLEQTLIICGGEFGRTPNVNPAGGRDHWPHGFSIALAGGAIRGGQVIGQTDPEGEKLPYEQGIPVEDIHATVLHALGIDHALELETPVGRPIKLSEGKLVKGLLG
jgi:hypothetical protein